MNFHNFVNLSKKPKANALDSKFEEKAMLLDSKKLFFQSPSKLFQ